MTQFTVDQLIERCMDAISEQEGIFNDVLVDWQTYNSEVSLHERQAEVILHNARLLEDIQRMHNLLKICEDLELESNLDDFAGTDDMREWLSGKYLNHRELIKQYEQTRKYYNEKELI